MNQNLSYDELLNLYNAQQNIINNQQDMLNKLSNKPKLDPFKILNVPRNYDLPTLKKAYIREAMRTHPDKGGNPVEFKNVQLSYKVLLKKYNNDQSNHDHNDLKQNQRTFNDTQLSNNHQNLSLDKKFNQKQFNQVFDENRMSTAFDDGYDDWYKSDNTNEQPVFKSKVGMSTFNNEFEKQKRNKLSKKKNQIQIREPEQKISISGADSIVVLGQGKVHNFGGTSNNLHYYDLKKAYDDNYINDTVEDVEERTISSVKRDRSNISYKMSNKDLQLYNKQKLKEKKLEEYRQKNLAKQDDMASKLYEQVHGRLVGR
tara:strand:- start:1548 stop:2492 length:945 start_codon:yes stop_codon:yes gene_type:complete